VLGCLRVSEVNPVEFLADVLPRLARRVRLHDLPDLLLARWKAGARRTGRGATRCLLNSTEFGVGSSAYPLAREEPAMRAQPEEPITLVVSSAELALLKKLDFPCSQGVLATARPDPEGIALHGSRADLSILAGWVAGEANHARRGTRRAELLDSLAEQLEDVLVTCGR
jgi:hypothetical protein